MLYMQYLHELETNFQLEWDPGTQEWVSKVLPMYSFLSTWVKAPFKLEIYCFFNKLST